MWSQTHLVPNAYGPQTFGRLNFWSLIDWSLCTNGPQPIQSPHRQMVPNQFGPPEQIQEDQISWGPFVRGTKSLGTICLWGPNLMGSVCPRGSFVEGVRKWGTGNPGIKWVRDQMRCSQNFRVWGIFFARTLQNNKPVDLLLTYPFLKGI